VFILAIGNILNGHQFTGPFPSADAAMEYGRAHNHQDCWAVAVMLPPPPPQGVTQ
jgi:hypothetical protein